MSNPVNITITKFVDLDDSGKEIGADYGLRISDNEDQTYTNGLKIEQVIGVLPMDIVELARGINDRAADMIVFAEDCNDGIYISDKFHAWADIKLKASTP